MERKVQSFRVTDDVSHKHQQHGCHQDTGFVMPVLPKWTGRRLNVLLMEQNGRRLQRSAQVTGPVKYMQLILTKHSLML